MPHDTATITRFWAKVDTGPACWEWTASKRANGYGQFHTSRRSESHRNLLAHRVSYELLNGPIPEGAFLDHICHNKACVNPAHLRLVTNKQNMENQGGPSTANKSGVPGVDWYARTNRWRAVVTHNRRQVHVGYFLAIEDAEAAVVAKRNELFTHNDRDRVSA